MQSQVCLSILSSKGNLKFNMTRRLINQDLKLIFYASSPIKDTEPDLKELQDYSIGSYKCLMLIDELRQEAFFMCPVTEHDHSTSP